jgi:hypothetical protein
MKPDAKGITNSIRARRPETPLAAVAAGAVGTACMDTIRYVLYRRYGAGTGTAFCLLARRL